MTAIEPQDQLRTVGDLVLSSRIDGNALVITARGEIDMESAPELRKILLDAIDGGCRRLVLSMRGVTFLDSTGLGALIAARKHARAQDGWLRLVGLHPSPAKVIKITGLSDTFPSWETVEDALAMD